MDPMNNENLQNNGVSPEPIPETPVQPEENCCCASQPEENCCCASQPEQAAAQEPASEPVQETASEPVSKPVQAPVNEPVQAPVNEPQRPVYQQSYQQTQPPFMANTAADPSKNGLAIASMILGIVSIVIGCCSFLSIPCAIVGIVLGILSLKSEKRGIAIAGIILSGVGAIFSILMIVLGAVFTQTGYMDRFWTDFGDMDYYYYS